MSRPRDFGPSKGAGDWSGNWRTLLMLWGFPGLAMLGALGLDPTPRAVVWTFMLSAMGLACIINSRRCGRTHCRFTGPFLIVMAILVIGHTIGWRSEEHTSELQSLMRISYAVFCLKKKTTLITHHFN